MTIKGIYFFSVFSLQGSPPLPHLDFGLCARVFSAVFLPLEPTIEFSPSPAVSPSQSRDFRLPEPAIPFSTWSAVVTSGEPAIPFYPLVSGLLPEVTSPEVPPARDRSRPIRSQNHCYLGPLYYWWQYFFYLVLSFPNMSL